MSVLRNMFGAKGAKKDSNAVDSGKAEVKPKIEAKSIMLIDDEQSVLNGLRRMIYTLRPEWTVATATNGQEGLRQLGEHSFDAVISDMSMPGMHGLSVLTHVRDQMPEVIRIALTGFVDEEWKVKQQGIAQVFLSKPCAGADVVDAIEDPARFQWTTLSSPAIPNGPIGRQRPLSDEARRTQWIDDEVKFS